MGPEAPTVVGLTIACGASDQDGPRLAGADALLDLFKLGARQSDRLDLCLDQVVRDELIEERQVVGRGSI